MPDAPDQGTAPQNLEQSYDSAAESLGVSQEPTPAPESVAPETPAPEGTVEPPIEDPEHIRWAKRIQGDFDPQTGQFVTDRIVKRAYELNKQAQSQAQELAAIRQALQRPEVAQMLQQALGGQQPKPDTAPVEKSDEQVLKEFVWEQAQQLVQPVVQQTHLLYDRYLQSEILSTHDKLKSAFGKAEDGTPVYETIASEVGNQLAQQAQLMNVPIPRLVSELVNRGILFQTLENLGKTILYPRVAEQAKKPPVPTVADRKKTNLPGRGTPPSAVKPAPKKISTFQDAVEAAETELAAQGWREP